MAHHGLLRDYRFSSDVDDVRGASVYGPDDDKVGKIDDVIFDHAAGNAQYVVVDTGGWLKSKKFLVPADQLRPYAKDEDDFAISMTKKQIESLPEYDEDKLSNDLDWNAYDKRYREAWDTGPVLHKENSTHAITPGPDELPAGSGGGTGVDLTPSRLAGKFPDPAPDPSKIRMRPASAARAEDSRIPGVPREPKVPNAVAGEAMDRGNSDPVVGQRDPLADPDEVYVSEAARHGRWSNFEDHLRRNRVDITANCGSCGTAKDKVA